MEQTEVRAAMETVAMADAGADISAMDKEIAEETLKEVAKKEPAKRDPKSNFHKLSKENQNRAELLAANILDELGGKDLDVSMLLGVIDLLNEEKKNAKALVAKKEKENKDKAKKLAEKNAEKLHNALQVGDTVDYLLKSKGLIIKDVEVIKITDKRFHVEVKDDTVIFNTKTNEEMIASEISDFKLGKKYIAFTAIVSINGEKPENFFD